MVRIASWLLKYTFLSKSFLTVKRRFSVFVVGIIILHFTNYVTSHHYDCNNILHSHERKSLMLRV